MTEQPLGLDPNKIIVTYNSGWYRTSGAFFRVLCRLQPITVFVLSVMSQCIFNFKVVPFGEGRHMTTFMMMKDLPNV